MALFTPNGHLIKVPEAQPGPNGYSYTPVTSSYRRGRVYMYGGLGFGVSGGVQPAAVPAPGSFNAALAADGWEVIGCPQPSGFIDPGPPAGEYWYWSNPLVNPDMRDDALFGARLRATQNKTFQNLDEQVCHDHGALPAIVGGGSWGAMTAAHIVMDLGQAGGVPLAGFFTWVTPTQLGQLVTIAGEAPGSAYPGPLLFPFNTSGMDLATVSPYAGGQGGAWSSSFFNSCRIPGFVSFGCLDVTVFPQGCDIMVMAALAAGAPLAQRVVTDALISSSGLLLTSSSFCPGHLAASSGQLVTGPGIPAGTTISSVTDLSGGANSGPWSMALSQAATNTPTIAITLIDSPAGAYPDYSTGTWRFTTATPHGLSVSSTFYVQQVTNTESGLYAALGTYNQDALVVTSVQSATQFTVVKPGLPGYDAGLGAYVLGGPITGYGVIYTAPQTATFPGLGPSFNHPHEVDTDDTNATMAWIQANIDQHYPMVL